MLLRTQALWYILPLSIRVLTGNTSKAKSPQKRQKLRKVQPYSAY